MTKQRHILYTLSPNACLFFLLIKKSIGKQLTTSMKILDPIVRIANRDDKDEIINLVKSFHDEEGLSLLSEDAVNITVSNALDGNGVVGVIGDSGAIESSIYLLMGRLWYSNANSLESLWNFTLPKYRKSGNTKALLSFAKRQSDKLDTPLLLDAVTTDENAPKIRLYERSLGERAGAIFHYTPNVERPTEVDCSKIRTADLSDADEIIEIARDLYAENGSFSKDEELAIPIIRQNLSGDGVTGVIGEKGKIEGIIFLHIAKMWYSDEPILEEFFAYVRPPYRNSKNAQNLIKFAKRQSDRLGINLRMCIVSRIETERKIQLYKRLLGEPCGAFFLYRSQNLENSPNNLTAATQ